MSLLISPITPERASARESPRRLPASVRSGAAARSRHTGGAP